MAAIPINKEKLPVTPILSFFFNIVIKNSYIIIVFIILTVYLRRLIH